MGTKKKTTEEPGKVNTKAKVDSPVAAQKIEKNVKGAVASKSESKNVKSSPKNEATTPNNRKIISAGKNKQIQELKQKSVKSDSKDSSKPNSDNKSVPVKPKEAAKPVIEVKKDEKNKTSKPAVKETLKDTGNKKTEEKKSDKTVEKPALGAEKIVKPDLKKNDIPAKVIKSSPVESSKTIKSVYEVAKENKATALKKESQKKELAAKAQEAKNDTANINNETIITLDPKVRFSDDDLDMFMNVISEHRQEALDELRMLKERLEDLTNYDFAEESMIYSMHMAEQGSEAMEKEKTYAQIQRINEYIKKLDDALQRIKEKTYGICRVCGCLIAKERLLAVPITTLSASYKIHQKCPEDGIDRIEPVKSGE